MSDGAYCEKCREWHTEDEWREYGVEEPYTAGHINCMKKERDAYEAQMEERETDWSRFQI